MPIKSAIITLSILSVVVFIAAFNVQVYFAYNYQRELLINAFYYSLSRPELNVQQYKIAGVASLLFLTVTIASALLRRKGIYGDARFARLSDVKAFQQSMLESTGLIVGKFKGRYLRNSSNQSVLVCAPQGTGKSAATIIPMAYSYEGSSIFLDVKGELWNITSKHRSQFSNCKLFAPTLGLDNHSSTVGFNPLDEKMINDIISKSKKHDEGDKAFNRVIDYIEKIANVVFPTANSDDKGKFFVGGAGDIFKFFATYNVKMYGGTSIPAIYDAVLESSDFKMLVANAVEVFESAGDTHNVRLGNSILNSSGDSGADILKTFTRTLSPFTSPIVRTSLERSDFTYEDFRKESFSLYLYVPTAEIEKLQPILSVMINYLTDEFLSHSYDKNEHQQVCFFLDEFYRLGKMQTLVDMPTLGRSQGLRAVFSFQNFGQMTKLYGKESIASMMSATDIKIFYQQNDIETAKQFSETIGKTTRKRKSRTSNNNLGVIKDNTGSRSENEEGVPLMLPQDFLNLKMGEVVVVAKGHAERPIKCKSVFWETEASMKNLGGYAHDFKIDD